MPTANVRYGRPKGSGLDDRQQLLDVAALIAANPALKPTTAIRALGVEDPATIRRLREKFRGEQARLMADAHRAHHGQRPRIVSNENTPEPQPATAAARPSRAAGANDAGRAPPAAVLLSGWCDLGLTAVSAAVTTQFALTQYWLGLPHVAMATRAQLALGSIAVAVYTRSRKRPQALQALH